MDGQPDYTNVLPFTWNVLQTTWYKTGLNQTTWRWNPNPNPNSNPNPYPNPSDPYLYTTANVIGFDMLGPIVIPSGQTIGVGGASVTVDSLSESLQNMDGDALVYVVEVPSLNLLGCSSANVPVFNMTLGKLITATDSTEERVSVSAGNLNASGFPEARVIVLTVGKLPYFVQSLTYSDEYGLNWRIVTVQQVDCDAGSEVGPSNSSCVKCHSPYTSRGGNGACVLCTQGYFLTAGGLCRPCPTNAYCSGLDAVPRPDKGYWNDRREPSLAHRIHACTRETCKGASTDSKFDACWSWSTFNKTINDTACDPNTLLCKTGANAFLCGGCSEVSSSGKVAPQDQG